MKNTGRPISVTILTILVLIFAASKVVRFIESIQSLAFFSEILPFPAVYLVLSGLFWTVISIPLILGLWLGAGWAPWYTRIMSIAYSIYYWLEFYVLVFPNRSISNWPFLLGINIVILAWIYWILSRKRVKTYFGEDNE